MADNENEDIVVPVVSEELHADAAQLVTGGVRVTKRVHTHEEILEQELRKSHAEVKRVKTNRVVDGPQPVQRNGNTLVIPIVSEVLRIEKQWIVTEEIHITQIEKSETVQQTVPVRQEEASIERLDESGNAIGRIETETALQPIASPASLIERAPADSSSARRTRSILKTRRK